MLHFFWYCYKNWSNLSETFLRNALYRKYRRIYFRFSVFDKVDKFFFFFAFLNILTGLLGFYVLGRFDLGIFESFIFYTFFNTYFYISSRKVLGWVYFSYYWVAVMGWFVLSFLCCLIICSDESDPFYSLFLFHSEKDLSLVFQYFLKFISGLKDNIEGNCYAFCIPPDDTPNPVAKPFWQQFISSHRKAVWAFSNSANSAAVAGGFSHVITGGNRRISIPAAICFGAIKFAVDITDDSDNL